MLTKVEVDSDLLNKAYANWVEFCHRVNHPIIESAFSDFLDPNRQTELLFYAEKDEGSLFVYPTPVEVTQQIAHRIELLAGKHFYTVLQANRSRFDTAQTSWGKK